MRHNMRKFINLIETLVYHGTPHNVDKFSTKHIGTGQGAKSFGWGLYFSSSEEVAEWYRQSLTGDKEYDPEWGDEEEPKFLLIDNKVISMKTPLSELSAFERAAIDWWLARQSTYTAIEEVEYGMKMFPGNHDHPNYKHYEEELEILKSYPDFHKRVFAVRGNLYSVNIIPHDDDFLNWDVTMEKQPKNVLARLKNIDFDPNEKGSVFYRRLSKEMGSDQAASLKLDAMGIPGIRYLIGADRKQGHGRYNYVVFDDRHINH